MAVVVQVGMMNGRIVILGCCWKDELLQVCMESGLAGWLPVLQPLTQAEQHSRWWPDCAALADCSGSCTEA